DVVVGEDLGDVAQQLGPVEGLDLDGDREHARPRGVPLDLDDAVLVAAQVVGVGAVAPVDADPVAAGDEADDRVAGHRGAAAGQLDPDVVDALDDHAPAGRLGPGLADGPLQDQVVVVVLLLLAAQVGLKLADPRPGRGPARPDGRVERLKAGEAHVGGERGQGPALGQLLQRQAGLAHGPDQRVLAGLDGVLAPLLGEPLADLVARPRGPDDPEPVPRGAGVLGL